MNKHHFNRTAFIKARVAKSVEHHTRNLKVVDSRKTLGKLDHCFVLMLSTRCWQVDWFHTNEIKHDIQPR